MNMFKSTSAKTPQEYIDLIEEPRKSEIVKLDNLIRKTIPSAKPFIEAGMLGYGKFHYKSKSGREGDWFLIGLASQKNYISLYVCAASSDGKYIAEKYVKSLPKANIGKSCVRFKKTEDVDLKIIEKMLLEAEKTGGLAKA